MRIISKSLIAFIAVMMIVSCLEGARAEMTKSPGNLPRTIGIWTRSESAQIIDASNIFDYMNGGGELYLAYRFDHLEVYEYTSDQQDDIVAEVYFMNTSDDAFGLLSLDWDGEPVTFSSSAAPHTDSTIRPPFRALYGGGLLRLWADTIYARVLAYRETPESKDAVLALGQTLAANRQTPAEPDLLKMLPPTIGSEWKLRRDRLGYFRSYLVLNSLYYLSHQNILNLDLSVEAVTAPYEHAAAPSTRIQILFVKYAAPEQARQALEQFHAVYLPEYDKEPAAEGTTKYTQVFSIEDGWLGYTLDGRCLAIVFECPDQASASQIMEHLRQCHEQGG